MLRPLSKAAENSFNAVRLLAALQVAYIHADYHLKLEHGPYWQWILQFSGVPIFFAVSGYLVFDSLLRWSLREFIVHRVARIYPALIVNIAIIEALLWLASQIRFSGTTFAENLAYFFSYALTASDGLAGLWTGSTGGAHTFTGFYKMYPSGVLWTLTVELTFYLLIPPFVMARSRVAQTVMIALASLASLAFQNLYGAEILSRFYGVGSITVLPYFWMFGIGMLFRLWRPPIWTARVVIPVLLVAFAVVAYSRGLLQRHQWKDSPTELATIQTGLLCLLALWVGFSPLLKSKWLARNDMSYGLYLYHMLIVTALLNVPDAVRTRWLLLVVFAGGMAAGLLSWHLIERPCMRRARKIPGRLPLISQAT